MAIKHAYVSAVADLGVGTEAGPSEWNAAHVVDGGSNGALLVRDSGQADGANWSSSYVGPYGIGAAPQASNQVRIGGAHSGAAALSVNSTIAVTANTNGWGVQVNPTLAEAGEGTHNLMAGLNVDALGITDGGATTTLAASLRVAGPPDGGTSRYALLVDNGVSRFDDSVLIGPDAVAPASLANGLVIAGSTAPSASVTNGVVLFAADVSGSHELRVRDEAGNVTTLSPHRFALFRPSPRAYAPWSYYCETWETDEEGRDVRARVVNVDMEGLVRTVERITGQRFLYEGIIDARDRILRHRDELAELEAML